MKGFIFLLLCTFSLPSMAQDIPAFKALRFDESYSFLKDDSSRSWYERIKYAELSKNQKNDISIGGDIRYQYLWFDNEDWGEAPKDRDGYILARYLTHVDLHAGKYFRSFFQLQSSMASGKASEPSPVDENPLDIHQLFFDVLLLPGEKQRMTLRLGRQEFLYGSQRLVSVREGPNNRHSFDAAKLIYKLGLFKADLFYSHYVRSRQKIFDDGFNKNTRFWGLYLAGNGIGPLKNLDLYYLGLRNRKANFDDGTGSELRHTTGARISNTANDWRYDVEGLYQFGSFTDKKISAWSFSVNTGYKFSRLKFRPEIGIKTEWISGDAEYGDDKLQTLHPLFPRGGYFGLVSLIGPANLFDIHPSLTLDLSRRIVLNVDYDVFWRYSKNDGIYGPNVAVIYSGKSSAHKYIGRQLSTDIAFNPNHFLYFRAEFTWFKAGDFLKDAGPGKDIVFTAFTAQLKF
jgi:hypothetical protein